MRAGRTMTERQSRDCRGDERVAVSAADTTVSVRVPLAFRQRRGRKVLVAPDGAGQAPLRAPQPPARSQRVKTSAVRALARAFRWRKLLETGSVVTVQEIAAAENINPSYVSRVLRLTLLAPEMVEALMADSSGAAAHFDLLVQPFTSQWHDQLRALLSGHAGAP